MRGFPRMVAEPFAPPCFPAEIVSPRLSPSKFLDAIFAAHRKMDAGIGYYLNKTPLFPFLGSRFLIAR